MRNKTNSVKSRAIGIILTLAFSFVVHGCPSGSRSAEDEAHIRRLFEQLARDLPTAAAVDIGRYVTETDHHESAGYHHQPVLEFLMQYRSLNELTIDVRNVSVTNDRAHARCRIRGQALGENGSAHAVEQEQVFELIREPGGWRIADHLVS